MKPRDSSITKETRQRRTRKRTFMMRERMNRPFCGRWWYQSQLKENARQWSSPPVPRPPSKQSGKMSG
jgi:hypothetical protein